MRVRPFAGVPAPVLRLLAVWTATRLLLLSLSVGVTPGSGDVELYANWARLAADGTLPGRDFAWEYPPLALLPIVLPSFLGADDLATYRVTFCLFMYALDAGVLAMLLRGARPPLRAAWCWTLGLPALGPVAYQRFDLVTAALAVAALVLGVRGRAAAPAAALLGAAVKVWPVLLLAPLVLLGRTRARSVAVIAASAAVLLAAAVGLRLEGLLVPFTYQRDRGLQLEAVAAVPLDLARALGHDVVAWQYRYGAVELVGGPVPVVVTVLQVVAVLAVLAVGVALLLRARRAAGGTALTLWSLLVLLVLVVTNKVLSPQYMTWLLAVACVAAGELPRRPALQLSGVTVAVMATTHAYYPYWYDDLVLQAELGPALLLAGRNALLLVLLALVVREVRKEWSAARAAAP